jgi:hypothetical protein
MLHMMQHLAEIRKLSKAVLLITMVLLAELQDKKLKLLKQ